MALLNFIIVDYVSGLPGTFEFKFSLLFQLSFLFLSLSLPYFCHFPVFVENLICHFSSVVIFEKYVCLRFTPLNPI